MRRWKRVSERVETPIAGAKFTRGCVGPMVFFVLIFFVYAICLSGETSAQESSQGEAAAVSQQNVDLDLGKAYEALRQDRFDDAVAGFRAALAINPSLAGRARFPLAVALFESHRLDEAQQQFELIRKQRGDHPNLSYYLGRISLERRDFKAAIRNLEAAAAAPPFPDTSYYLGYAYFKDGNLTVAEKWLKEAAKSNPNDARIPYQRAQILREQGLNDEAANALARSSEIRKRQDQESQIKTQCAKALDTGINDNSRALCNQLFDANDPEWLTALGTLYGQHGDYESALKPFERAAELSPQSPQMRYNVALAYFYLHDFRRAQEQLAGAVKRWPDLYQLSALYGAVLANLGDELSAYKSLKHAHDLDPQNPDTLRLLYSCTMKLGQMAVDQKRNAGALQYFREAAALAPTQSDPHEAMANVYRLSGELKQAEAELAKAQQLTRSNRER